MDASNMFDVVMNSVEYSFSFQSIDSVFLEPAFIYDAFHILSVKVFIVRLAFLAHFK